MPLYYLPTLRLPLVLDVVPEQAENEEANAHQSVGTGFGDRADLTCPDSSHGASVNLVDIHFEGVNPLGQIGAKVDHPEFARFACNLPIGAGAVLHWVWHHQQQVGV